MLKNRSLFKSFVAEAFDVEYAEALNAAPEFRKTMLADIIFKASGFDESKHPRSNDGRFIGRESINAAKSDPALAEKLREKTTDPEERKKLDAALKGESDLGRTKAGLHREKVAAAKKEKSDRVARVRDLADEISMARRGGEPVSAEHFRALVADLPHLTIKDLRSVRLKLAASFFGRTKREDLVTALVHQAKMRAEQIEYDARHAEDDPLDFGMDAMTSVADRPSDRRQEDANPWHKLDKMDASNYGPAQHGGRMYQRHTLDREHGVKDTVAYNTHGPDVKPYWLDEDGKPVDVITPTIAKRKEPPPEGTPVATPPPPDQPQGDMPTKSPTAANNPFEGPPTVATTEPVATESAKPAPKTRKPRKPKVADEQLTKKPSEAVTASQSVAKAASAPSGWVGDDLLLINHAFNHLKATDPAYSEMTLDQFKDQLVRENGKSVKLSRADLPQALDPNDVRESQTQHPAMKGQHGGEFHFIKVPRKKGQ